MISFLNSNYYFFNDCITFLVSIKMKRTIYLQKIGELEQTILDKLKKNLEKSFKDFKISVEIVPEELPLKQSEYDAWRRQYDASKILDRITKKVQNKLHFRTLGVIDKDIFSRHLNFVFGLASSPKIWIFKLPVTALISVIRLREKFYERPEDKKLFDLRTLKEAIHELGHTFNLAHCDKYCIMRFSNSLTDTDEKPKEFCESCSIKLKNFFNNLKNSN